MELFEKATRQALRFATPKGTVTTEDLWTLSLTDLEKVAQGLDKQIKETSSGTFFTTNTKTKDAQKLQLCFEVVLHVGKVKKEEKEAREMEAERQEKKRKLLELIAGR